MPEPGRIERACIVLRARRYICVPMSRLTAKQIQTKLATLEDWTRSGAVIQRTFAFNDFLQAMRFVDKVAAEAERVQHHPDIMVRYSKVTLALSTHDVGGISDKDFDFAVGADRLFAADPA